MGNKQSLIQSGLDALDLGRRQRDQGTRFDEAEQSFRRALEAFHGAGDQRRVDVVRGEMDILSQTRAQHAHRQRLAEEQAARDQTVEVVKRAGVERQHLAEENERLEALRDSLVQNKAQLNEDVASLQAQERHLRNWVDLFKQEGERMRIDSPVERHRIWFIGRTGAGKSTSIGRLLDSETKLGRSGLSHDTLEITERDMNYISNRQIKNIILMDTRGPGDTGLDVKYKPIDLYLDMSKHVSQSDMSRVVYVYRGSERFVDQDLAMLKDLDRAFGTSVAILATKVSDKKREKFLQEIGRILPDHGLSIPRERIACVDWKKLPRHSEPESVKRWEIMDVVMSVPEVNVRRLAYSSMLSESLESLEKWLLKHLRKRGGADLLVPLVTLGFSMIPDGYKTPFLLLVALLYGSVWFIFRSGRVRRA